MVENITRLPQEKSDAQASARCKGSFFPAIIGEKFSLAAVWKNLKTIFFTSVLAHLHIFHFSTIQQSRLDDHDDEECGVAKMTSSGALCEGGSSPIRLTSQQMDSCKARPSF